MLSGNFYLIKISLIRINMKIFTLLEFQVVVGMHFYGRFNSRNRKIVFFCWNISKYYGSLKLTVTEQSQSEIYKEIDYWNLYKLSTLDEYNPNNFIIKFIIKMILVVSGPYADMMYSAANKINDANFTVLLVILCSW